MLLEENIEGSKIDISIPSKEFIRLALNKFCVKKHFEIGLITAAPDAEDFLKNLIELNKIKEEITHVTFIGREDVADFMDFSKEIDFEFPPFLTDELKSFRRVHSMLFTNEEEFNTELEAYSVKFKLIQTMYQQYASVVKGMRHQQMLDRELEMLAGKKNKKPNESRSKQSTAHSTRSVKNAKTVKTVKNTPPLEDYTETELKDNDIIVDDLLENQVYFYIFHGYDDLNIIKYLFQAGVKLSFIIHVAEFEPDEKRELSTFWKTVYFKKTSPCDYLENVAIFKYQAPPLDETNLDLETHLKELVKMLKSLVDLKRLHFQYIKHLKIIDTKFTEKFKSFSLYEKLMEDYLLETITIPIIINCMIQEVQMKVDKIPTSLKTKKRTFINQKIQNGFDITSHLRSYKQKLQENKELESFKLYKNDVLNLTLKSYREADVQYVKDNLSILNLQLPVRLAQQFVYNVTDDINHTHDMYIPSEDQPVFTEEQTNYLINLLYLKKKYSYEKHITENTIGNEFTTNLIIHNKNKDVQIALPKCLLNEAFQNLEPFIDCNPDSNNYEEVKPMELHWVEILNPEVLLQYLFEAGLTYLYCDFIPCELTNSLLVRYHNGVDSFGLNTKVWCDYLRTPVGLGDFCEHTLVDDYEWLKKNKVYSQITYEDVEKMTEEKTAIRLHGDAINSEYQNCLLPQIIYSSSGIRQSTNYCTCIEENACKIQKESCNEDSQMQYTKLESNLDEILKELEEYKNIVDLSEYCKRKQDEEYSFTAYNFGLRKYRILGHTTNFISLDNVRVTVDSSRFIYEKFKLTVKISTDDNLFVLHTVQKNCNFHLVLSDGSIIVFEKPILKDKVEGSKKTSDLTLFDFEEAMVHIREQPFLLSELSNDIGESEVTEEVNKIRSMNLSHYSSLRLYPIVGDQIRETPTKLYKTKIAKELDILTRLKDNESFLKVSNKSSKHLKYLERKNDEYNIAVSNIVRRIMNDPVKKQNCEFPKRKCIIKDDLPPRKKNYLAYNVTMTLPNGLRIKLLPSEILPMSSVIRQGYDYTSSPREISGERYRMFTNDGTIIIGKLDGTMTLLTSSGNEVRFGKPKKAKDNDSHCKYPRDLSQYTIRKLLIRIMSDLPNQSASDYYISRRGHLRSKFQSVHSCESLHELAKIPYSAMSIITCEGYRITLKNEKLIKSLHSRHITENNLLTKEELFKREDGFRSTIDRDGTFYVKYSDGTCIKTVMHVNEDPDFINKEDEMGWIVVTATYFYEHPFYKPVVFDNVSCSMKIHINELACLSITSEGALVQINNSTILDIKTDYINLVKTCPSCDSQYVCKLYVEPLYNCMRTDSTMKFITVEDSYNKQFKSDFLGNCMVTPSYLESYFNIKGCNHTSLVDHQKFFLIKSDLSGMLLWNDKAALAAIENSKKEQNIQHFSNAKDNLVFLTFTQNVYSRYEKRFSTKILDDIEDIFYQTPKTGNFFYQLSRNLHSILELDQIDDLMRCLGKFFQEEVMEELANSLNSLKYALQTSKFSIQASKYSLNASKYSLKPTKFPFDPFPQSKEPDEVIITKPKKTIQERIMERYRRDAQLKKLMREPVPNYFNWKFNTFK